MFCHHDWAPRTGMDSGSVCVKCTKVSSKEVDFSTLGGLSSGRLVKSESFLEVGLRLLSESKPKNVNAPQPESNVDKKPSLFR